MERRIYLRTIQLKPPCFDYDKGRGFGHVFSYQSWDELLSRWLIR